MVEGIKYHAPATMCALEVRNVMSTTRVYNVNRAFCVAHIRRNVHILLLLYSIDGVIF